MEDRMNVLRERITAELERRDWSARKASIKAGLGASTLGSFLGGSKRTLGPRATLAVARVFDWEEGEALQFTGLGRTAVTAPRTLGAYRIVPHAHVRVAAGDDLWLPTGEGYTVAEEDARGRELVALTVTGDCLVPEVQPGDVVLVDRARRTPVPGDLVVLVGEQGAMLKRYDVEHGKPVLRDARGRTYRPNGARMVGVVFEVRRRTLRRVAERRGEYGAS